MTDCGEDEREGINHSIFFLYKCGSWMPTINNPNEWEDQDPCFESLDVRRAYAFTVADCLCMRDMLERGERLEVSQVCRWLS